MPLPATTPPSFRSTSTPSPQPLDVLNTLLQVKDTVNTKLLEETKQSVDLAHIHTTVEEQLREVIEQTIRTVKIEFDRRRRKTIPIVRRLEETLKSLIKAEKKLHDSERFNKKGAVKKAQRRVRNAQRILQEYSLPETETSLQNVLTDQISTLCQRLQLVPAKLTATCSTPMEEATPRDSDSDESIESPRKEYTRLHDALQPSRIEHIRTREGRAENDSVDTVTKAKHTFQSTGEFDPLDIGTDVEGNRLNGVHLFSSDSDSFEETADTDEYRPIKVRAKQTNVLEKSPGRTESRLIRNKSNDTEYENGTVESSERLCRLDLEFDDTRRKSRATVRGKNAFSKDHKLAKKADAINRNPTTRVEQMNVTGKPRYEHANQEKDDNGHSADSVIDSDKNYFDKSIAYITKSEKVIHKRMLPPLPLHVLNESQSSTHDNHMPSANELPSAHRNTSIPNHTHGRPITNTHKTTEKIDLEEIKFKESVRTARRQIIDKIKSKCTMPPSHYTNKYMEDVSAMPFSSSTPYPVTAAGSSLLRKYSSTSALDKQTQPSGEHLQQSGALPFTSDLFLDLSNLHDTITLDDDRLELDRHADIEKNIKDITHEERIVHDTTQCNDDADVKSDKAVHERTVSPCVYKGRLVHILDTSTQNSNGYGHEPIVLEPTFSQKAYLSSNSDNSHSIVEQGIKKFENEITKDQESPDVLDTSTNGQFKGLGVLKGQVYVRHRSASEGRTKPSATENFQSNNPEGDRFQFSNMALKPRMNSNVSQLITNDDDQKESSTMLKTYPFRRQNTESELHKLCKTDSAVSIREGWRQRRSSSLTPKLPERTYKIGPTFDYKTSFQLRDYGTRCQASGILQLADGFIVVLDRRNSSLQLFNINYEALHAITISDISGGIVEICGNKFALSYPYRSRLGIYKVVNGLIEFDNELVVPCTEWVTDIGFACNLIHVLCKAGDIHIIKLNGAEEKLISTGSNGKLLVHPSGKRFYILGEGRVIRFDSKGNLISSRGDIDAFSVILLKDRLYAADRQKHVIVPVTDFPDVNNLTSEPVEFPSAVSVSKKGNVLLVSQFEENMPEQTTRTIKVFKLRR